MNERDAKLVQLLNEWLEMHDELTAIDIVRIGRDQKDPAITDQLLDLVAALERQGIVDVAYRARLPDNTLTDEDWPEIDSVPDCVLDDALQPVRREDTVIVPVYRLPLAA